MKQFTIDIKYCTSVSIIKEFEIYKTEEEKVLAMLKYGKSKGTSQWTEDHPEFTKLREQLGKDGYIQIQRGWWNGDSVLKPFILNGKKFKKNDQFMCGAAIKYYLEC